MLSVEEARDLVLKAAGCLPAHSTPLSDALGCTLAEEITSDVDSPPHDKSIVDGYALIAASVTSSPTKLRVIEEVTAGQVPTQVVEPGTATRIMTGAPLPAGADAVVMVEKTANLDGDPESRVLILESPVKPGQNIVRRGASMRRGDQVLAADLHRRLRPIEIGLLAEVGRSTVQVFLPTAAILATGNELVPASQTPGPGQIRNSNGPMLLALARDAGAAPLDLEIARDDAADLRVKIEQGLDANVLILSGGVSAGVLDLVPQVLADCGVREVFHKVDLKPGKPLWFGVRQHDDRRTLVFGLPGNPVSSLVCFELFVRPALKKLAGHRDVLPHSRSAKLTKEHSHRGGRVTYWPSRLEEAADGTRQVTPLAWQGSGDLRTLTEANALAVFSGQARVYAAAEAVEVIGL